VTVSDSLACLASMAWTLSIVTPVTGLPVASAPANGERESMHIADISFSTTDWSSVTAIEHKGGSGVARWRTVECGAIRLRMVECTPGYVADHWCTKGHVLLCLEGELHTRLEDGRTFVLTPGMSFQVADDAEPHRSSTPFGARLFIVD
jgi:hypothetical protein